MLARILSAAVLVPAVLIGVYYARPWPFLLILGLIGTLCLHEYFSLVRGMGIRAHPIFGYAAFWLLMAGMKLSWVPSPALPAGLLMAAFLAAMGGEDPLRDRALSLMAAVLGLFYPAFFLYTALPLRFEFGDKPGIQWFVIVLAVTWAGDTLALFAGKRYGRAKLAPKISPGKTKVGAVAGLLGGTLAAILLRLTLFRELPAGHVIALSLLAGISGQLGDLSESMLKRAADIKDSSHLIPGHGGVLDRIDSLLFAFPASYLYLWALYRP